MSDFGYDNDRTRLTKEGLLRVGLSATPAVDAAVPDIIQRSWRRCLSVSAPSTRVAVPYLDALDRHAQLVDAARPVFERIGGHLTGMGVALFLSDNKGQIVLRQVSDRAQRNVYDNASAAEGFDFSENAIGTNGLGTVIEERQPVFVRGSEHFNEALESLACAGVPIFKPYTRQVIGSFALACRSDSASALMYGVSLDVARQIETGIANMQGNRERALAQAYLAANQSLRDPVIVVSERTALANTIGLQYLSNESHALLWRHLLTQPGSATPTRTRVPLDGAHRDAMVRRVAGAGEDATYLLRLLPQPREQPARVTAGAHRRGLRAHPDHPVEAVDEVIHPMSAVNEQLVTSARSGSCMVIDGAPGTGKRTVAEAVLRRTRPADDPPLVVDISVASRGELDWYGPATQALAAGRGLILTHLQDLPRREVNIVKAIAQRPAPAGAAERGPSGGCAVVLTVSLADSPPHVVALVSQLGTPVELPSLRTINGWIPELVKQILADLPPGSRPSYVSTGALQALMRWDWPGNHAELRRTVQELAHRLPGQTIDVIHLPPRFRTTARTRSLSLMESAERDAIVETLHRTGDNRTQAAAALGIGRTTLYRKIRAYRIHE